jgi:hypothetical protein
MPTTRRLWLAAVDHHPRTLSAHYPRATRSLDGLQSLYGDPVFCITLSSQATCDTPFVADGTYKIGKLSFVAGAEIPGVFSYVERLSHVHSGSCQESVKNSAKR